MTKLATLSVCIVTALLIAPMTHSATLAENVKTTSRTPPPEQQKTYSRKEAYRVSTGRIVLHYGSGTKGVKQIEEILNEKGYPTVAYPGGPEDMVSLFIHRSRPINYDQDDIDDGTLGSTAMNIYMDRLGKPD